MELEVIGAGFGRTGTLSLKLALEQLGYGPCYHMMEVFANPGHAALWSAAADGDLPAWPTLFAAYGATVDWPASYFWRELADAYPRARIILTERDPESWYRSMSDTIVRAITEPTAKHNPNYRMAVKIVLESTFGGRFDDRTHALQVFRDHNRALREAFPAQRLLVYRVSEGWAPLCEFLDRPLPETPFPRANTTAEFKSRTAP